MYTVGYGDITPVSNGEKIFNILLFVVGTCVVAMVIVYVSDIVCQLDVTSDIYKMRLQVSLGWVWGAIFLYWWGLISC